jgi:hypothetical protein
MLLYLSDAAFVMLDFIVGGAMHWVWLWPRACLAVRAGYALPGAV